MVRTESDVATVLPPQAPGETDSLKSRLVHALSSCEGNVTRAAQKLGMARSGFYEALKRFNLEAASFRKK